MLAVFSVLPEDNTKALYERSRLEEESSESMIQDSPVAEGEESFVLDPPRILPDT